MIKKRCFNFSFVLVLLISSCSSEFASSKGTNIYHNGKKLFIRGAALIDDSTLWEPNRTVPNSNALSERDWAFTALGGLNTARLVVKMDYFFDEKGSERPEGFAFLDKQIALAKKYKLLLLLDMHVPSGGAAQDFKESEGSKFFWQSNSLQSRFVAGWKDIANHYKQEKQILGFELLNEPSASLDEYCSLLVLTYKAVRSEDKNHMIVVQPNKEGILCKIPMKNWAASYHVYEPMSFTHQNIHWDKIWHTNNSVAYSSQAQGEGDILEKKIQSITQISKNLKVPIIIGEFGVSTAADEASIKNWIGDIINNVETNNLAGYIYWRQIGHDEKMPTMAVINGNYNSPAQFFGIRPALTDKNFDFVNFYKSFGNGENK